jgi:hypothetical protein
MYSSPDHLNRLALGLAQFGAWLEEHFLFQQTLMK